MAQRESTKIRRKKWMPILATKYFNNTEIGETISSDSASLIGKNVSVNLMNLTQDIKTQNTKITFKIREVQNEKALTEIVKYEIVPSSLKRMVHKDKEKIDDSFKLKTKDNVEIRIKPFLVTRSSVQKSVLTALRKKTHEILSENIQKSTYETFLEILIRFRIQNILKKELAKIYPLSNFQIKKLEKINS